MSSKLKELSLCDFDLLAVFYWKFQRPGTLWKIISYIEKAAKKSYPRVLYVSSTCLFLFYTRAFLCFDTKTAILVTISG